MMTDISILTMYTLKCDVVDDLFGYLELFIYKFFNLCFF